jgi:hypothetical protein
MDITLLFFYYFMVFTTPVKNVNEHVFVLPDSYLLRGIQYVLVLVVTQVPSI